MTSSTDRHYSFYDPFADVNIIGPGESTSFPDTHVDAPPPYDAQAVKSILTVVTAAESQPTTIAEPTRDSLNSFTIANSFSIADSKSFGFAQSKAFVQDVVHPQAEPSYSARIDMDIQGQGTIVANCTAPKGMIFSFSTDQESQLSLYVQVTDDSIGFWYGSTLGHGAAGILPPDMKAIAGVKVGNPVNYLRPLLKSPARYWVSVDRSNGVLRFGRDYTNAALTLYVANLKESVDAAPWNDKKHQFIEKLSTVDVWQLGGELGAPMQLVYMPMPVARKLPPTIVRGDEITLDQLAAGIVTVPANLSLECQRLYDNVAGPNILLDTLDFPHFSAAIERSVKTEGLLCRKLLEKKAEGGKPYENTYLRITLGVNVGNSPGSPYVLEIWPAGHASPIHDHGDSHAVIKVLHGKIKAYYYQSLQDARVISPPARLQKGDITWIDPQNYQVHQLSNEYDSVCCTIQCYTYGEKDTRHDEFFDYITEVQLDGKPNIEHNFEPNSDMRFELFKEAIKNEWDAREL